MEQELKRVFWNYKLQIIFRHGSLSGNISKTTDGATTAIEQELRDLPSWLL